MAADVMRIELPGKFAPLLTLKCRYKIMYGGRGGGKSHQVAIALLILGARNRLRILCCREIQLSIKESAHQLLVDKIRQLGLQNFYSVTENEIRGANGTQIRFRGLSSVTSEAIKSFEGVDIAWVEEASSVSVRSWQILLPTIRKEGSEVWATFNPASERDYVYDRFVKHTDPDAWVQYISIDDNPFASDTLRQEAINDYERDPEQAAHVWGGRPLPSVEGAIYKQEMIKLRAEGRILPLPLDPYAPVSVSFDLGREGTAVIVGQHVGHKRHILHAFQEIDKPISFFVDWLKNLNIRIDRFALPHDARHISTHDDLSTRGLLAKSFPSAEFIIVGRDSNNQVLSREEQINAVRDRFHTIEIDSTKCEALLNALDNYKRKYDKVREMWLEPQHDSYSHMADSFRYWVIQDSPRAKQTERKDRSIRPRTLL